MQNEKRIDRKTFLKEGPKVFLRAFAQGAREESTHDSPVQHFELRPPGAASGEEFLELCCGVGACAEVCPADAIQLHPRKDDPERLAPVIVPHEAACVVCDDLACMTACPSGALRPVSREEIRIGRARIRSDECLAWAGIDPGCNYCVDRCPLGTSAIVMKRKEEARGPVVQNGCIGCGVCEFYCPVSPSAIRVFEIVGK